MAHMIENENVFVVREPAWHNLGRVVAEAPNSQEALELAGMDWDVTLEPVYAKVGENEFAKAPEYYATVRSTDHKVMGVVSGNYKVVQNREAFAFTDALIGTGDVKYESAGVLTNNKVWMLARMPEVEIFNDVVEPYLCFTNGFDGKTPVTVAITPVRVVCQNTLRLALKGARRTWTTKHKGNIESKLQEAQDTLNNAHVYISHLQEDAVRLNNIKLSKDVMDQLIEDLFPITKYDGPRKVNNILALRNELTYRFHEAPDLQKFDHTGWRFIQSVTDLVGHMEPQRQTDTYADNRFSKILAGHPVVDTAYKMLEELSV